MSIARRLNALAAPTALAALIALTVGAPALAQRPRPRALDDERVKEAWSYLLPAEQQDVASRLSAEVEGLGTFQLRLLQHALTLDDTDAGLYPEAPKPEYYDPEVHAPKQPIPRKWVREGSSKARRQVDRFLKRIPVRRLTPSYLYHWGLGRIVRLRDPEDPDLIFANALAGFPPGLDLAEARVERFLDGGDLRAHCAAFEHAYTDRDGNAFADLTLYDAWSSGVEFEMPDVDALGVIHDLLPKERRWVAPVPNTQHDPLYKRIGELFAEARRYRGLRTALARTYLTGSADLRDAYDFHVDRLHALWDQKQSTPAQLVGELPGSEDWSEFMGDLAMKVEETAKLRDAGLLRHATLDRDGQAVRELLVSILQDVGALNRTKRPDPPKPEKPKGEGPKGNGGG